MDLQVVLVANSLPALNDVTANELPEIIAEASKVQSKYKFVLLSNRVVLSVLLSSKFTELNVSQHCGILRKAAEAGGLLVDAMAGIQDDLKDAPESAPLMVVENGCGSPCIDFRQVSSELAAAAKDADLVRRLYFELDALFRAMIICKVLWL